MGAVVTGVYLGRLTVTVRRASATAVTRNGYGNIPSGPARQVSEFTVPGCLFQPGQGNASVETVTDNQDRIVTRSVLFAPYGSDIQASDQLIIAGITYEVDGDPAPWLDGSGVPHHFEAYLKRWEG